MGTPSLRLIFPEKPLYNNLYGARQDLEVGSDDISGGDGIIYRIWEGGPYNFGRETYGIV